MPWPKKKKKKRQVSQVNLSNLLRSSLHESHFPMVISQVHNQMKKSLSDSQQVRMISQYIFPTSEYSAAQIITCNGQHWREAQSSAIAGEQLG